MNTQLFQELFKEKAIFSVCSSKLPFSECSEYFVVMLKKDVKKLSEKLEFEFEKVLNRYKSTEEEVRYNRLIKIRELTLTEVLDFKSLSSKFTTILDEDGERVYELTNSSFKERHQAVKIGLDVKRKRIKKSTLSKKDIEAEYQNQINKMLVVVA